MASLQQVQQLAKQGNPKAIAALINHSLQKYQVQAEVQAEAMRLTVFLTGTAAPAPQLAARVKQGLLSLNLTQFSELVVVGFRQGTEAATWVKRFALAPTTEAELAPTKRDHPIPTSPNTTPVAATGTTPKSISSVTKATDAIDIESQRSKQSPQRTKSPVTSPSHPLPTSSAFPLSTKQLTIGLCLVGVIAGGALYKNWWRLLNAMGHTATRESMSLCKGGINGSRFYLASGGTLEDVHLHCFMWWGNHGDDPKSISLWLKRTANNPDQVDATSRTLLQKAVQFQKVELVQQALEHGADPNFSTNAVLLPLVQAVSPSVDTESSRKLVQLLLDHGADVTHTWTISDGQSYNALAEALLRDDLTIAQMLIDAGMEYAGSVAINLKGIGRSTDFTLLETLIDQGLDVKASEGALQISPPLFQAVELENMALARFLLSHGATISADQHQRLLEQASSPNQRNILALLSEQGVQMTVPPGNSDGVR